MAHDRVIMLPQGLKRVSNGHNSDHRHLDPAVRRWRRLLRLQSVRRRWTRRCAWHAAAHSYRALAAWFHWRWWRPRPRCALTHHAKIRLAEADLTLSSAHLT